MSTTNSAIFLQHKCNFTISTPSLYSNQAFIEDVLGKGEKIVKANVQSTRMDTIIKAGLKLSKNKIEKYFYDDRIRLDGERPAKKSQEIHEGSQIDIVRKINELNPKFLDVTRVEVIDLEFKGSSEESEEDSDDAEGKIPVVLKTFKLLTIDNYADPWKGNADSD